MLVSERHFAVVGLWKGRRGEDAGDELTMNRAAGGQNGSEPKLTAE